METVTADHSPFISCLYLGLFNKTHFNAWILRCLSGRFSVSEASRGNDRTYHANAAGLSDVFWRHVSAGEIWCCGTSTWSVVYFFQERWKCCWKGGGGGGPWNCETAFPVRVTLLSISKETRRPTLKPGKCRAEPPIFLPLERLLNSARPQQYVLFCFRARASSVLSSLFVHFTGSWGSSSSLQLVSTKL